MALPEDFNKIYGSTATGGLTPINDVDYAKGWEFVGSNPPTKNDFSYLQNLSDLKSQWLYSNKLQRADPFGDIKSDGTVEKALENLGLVDVDSGRLVGPPQIFTSSGTYTPNPKAKRIIVEVQGGGGGGAGTNSPSVMSSASGSGASGAYAKGVFDNPTTQTVTIGSGGTGGVDNPAGNGNAGGQSSFGSLITAVGGNGGQAMTADTGVLSASIAGAVPAIQFTGANIFGRGCGMPGLSVRLSAGVSYSGNGGDSQMGAGGLGIRGQSRGGDGTGPGAGGAGANVNGGVAGSYTGGNGAAGIVIVWEYM